MHAEFSAHLPRSFDDVRKTKPARIVAASSNSRQQILGCCSAIHRRNDRGATTTQKPLANAHTLYLQDRGRPFKHVTCWELLKDCQNCRDFIDPSKVSLLYWQHASLYFITTFADKCRRTSNAADLRKISRKEQARPSPAFQTTQSSARTISASQLVVMEQNIRHVKVKSTRRSPKLFRVSPRAAPN